MVRILRHAATIAAVAFGSLALAFALPVPAQAKNSGGGSSNSQTRAAPPGPTPKIKGESQEDKHPDTIHTDSAPTGNAGKKTFNPVSTTKKGNHSNP